MDGWKIDFCREVPLSRRILRSASTITGSKLPRLLGHQLGMSDALRLAI